jgi:uncharacterized protein (DUF58 family)
MRLGRFLYVAILLGFAVSAWFTGERMLFVAAAVFAAVPVISLCFSMLMLMLLGRSHSIPKEVVKGREAELKLMLHNRSPLPFGVVHAIIKTEPLAIDVEQEFAFELSPVRARYFTIPFVAKYRGHFPIGISRIEARDMTGLFTLRRSVGKPALVTVLPYVPDLSSFPLAMNLLTQATSRHDIRDEDYATISDIRQYVPTDSIKRVHWKLTAKRQEWLVKVFQANALNQVSLIFDATQPGSYEYERLVLEDSMVSMAAGLTKFCVNNAMPVAFMATSGEQGNAARPVEFEVVYRLLGELRFLPEPPIPADAILSDVLNAASGYVNAVIFTARPDTHLAERILNARGSGHHMALVYFPQGAADRNAEQVFAVLEKSGVQTLRIEGGSI